MIKQFYYPAATYLPAIVTRSIIAVSVCTCTRTVLPSRRSEYVGVLPSFVADRHFG